MLEVLSTSVYTGLNPLILFANTLFRSACEMFLMNAVIAVFNSLSVVGDHDTLQILVLPTHKSLVE
jgi:hypothetical protein